MFMGWVKSDGSEYNFNNNVTSNITIKASWKAPTAEEFLEVFYAYYIVMYVNQDLSSYLTGDITAEKITTNTKSIKNTLTAAFTRDNNSKRYEVLTVNSNTASGKIVSETEAENVYISFTYKCQTSQSSGVNDDWQDDSGATEQTGYIAYTFKVVGDEATSNTATVTNFKTNIQVSNQSALPTVSNDKVKEYKNITAYYEGTGESATLTGFALDGVKLSDAEANKVKPIYNNF
jgi:hypothetical protein